MPHQTLPRRVTDDDYCTFPDDGKRYEVLDGEVYMTRAPSPHHQFAGRQLQRILEGYFGDSTEHLVLNAPLDVILAPEDVVQPDIVVVPRGPQLSKRGVVHFWIVDPDARALKCYRLVDRILPPRGLRLGCRGGDRARVRRADHPARGPLARGLTAGTRRRRELPLSHPPGARERRADPREQGADLRKRRPGITAAVPGLGNGCRGTS